MVFKARSGWIRSYQSAFVQVFPGPSRAGRASGINAVISDGPDLISFTNLDMGGKLSYQSGQKIRIAYAIFA